MLDKMGSHTSLVLLEIHKFSAALGDNSVHSKMFPEYPFSAILTDIHDIGL